MLNLILFTYILVKKKIVIIFKLINNLLNIFIFFIF